MTIVLERFDIPERGVLKLDLHESIEIRVTAAEARHKVNSWVHEYVSYMMRADEPTLVIGKQCVWRAPVMLTSSQVGDVGVVGFVGVDVRTGEMNNTPESKERLIQCARELARKTPPFEPIESVPDEYIPKHLPKAKMAQLPEENR